MNQARLSVVIPTYNRKDTLARTLGSLAAQSMRAGDFQVILVDDGSADSTHELQENSYPFPFTYLRQSNLGATQARNMGAAQSNGKTLVFLDDDICIRPQALEKLETHCWGEERTIALGTLVTPDELIQRSIFARVASLSTPQVDRDLHFSQCMTGLLAIRRSDFFILGQFQDPSGGWPNWDDLDFGYRAHRQGFRLLQCVEAIGEHYDYSLLNLESSYNRLWRASKSAVRLFEVYPELQYEIPMFRDSLPIRLNQDSPRLMGRKLLRRIASTRCVLWWLESLTRSVEKFYSGKPLSSSAHHSPHLLLPLYRWIVGGYIYRGYQAGLHEASLAAGSDQ